MKKIMLIGSALLVVLSSSSVFASQARLVALGMSETDNDGMYYISDARNIFLNPAFVNLYPNQAVLEWGNVGQYTTVLGTTSGSTINNNTSNPKAQGGAFKKYGDFVYGVYLGNESNTSSFLRIAGTSGISALNGITNTTTYANTNSKMLQTADNQVDVFFGGEGAYKWGVNALYANGKDDTRTSKDSAAAIRGGLIGSNWDAHLNLSLASKSEASESIAAPALGVTARTVSQSFKGKLGYQLGGSYAIENKGRVFGYVKQYGWDQTDDFAGYAALSNAVGGQNGTVKGDFTSFYLGWGRDFDVNSGDKIFTSLTAKQTNVNVNFTNKTEVKHLIIPLTIGYEAKANEWLTIRGSVVQNIYGQKDNKNVNDSHTSGTNGTQLNAVAKSLLTNVYGASGKSTLANSTVVNAGATLNFGQLTVDGLIGTTSGTGGSVVSATNSNAPKKGILSGSNLQTSVAATYKF
jgi:hypothetical protein